MPGQHLRIDVAQRLDARPGLGDRRDRRLAFRAAGVVLRRLEPPRCIGVADDEHVLAGRQRSPGGLRASGSPGGAPAPAVRAHRRLVHDPALHADVVVLARWQSRASCIPSMPWVARFGGSSKAKADASSSAADDDSPADIEVAGQDAAEAVEPQPADWSDQAVAAT